MLAVNPKQLHREQPRCVCAKAAQGQRPVVSLSQWHFFFFLEFCCMVTCRSSFSRPGKEADPDLTTALGSLLKRTDLTMWVQRRSGTHFHWVCSQFNTLPGKAINKKLIPDKSLLRMFPSDAGASFPPFPTGSSLVLILLWWFALPYPAAFPAGGETSCL